MKRRSEPRLGPPARALMGCGGLLFALFGLLPAWPLLVRPATELLRSLTWPSERCEVLYSGVDRWGGEYRPVVAYAYQAGGRERLSARFEVLPRNYKEEGQARTQASAYVAGQPAACYVSADRSQVVLKRRVNAELFLGLLPLLFLLPAALFFWLAAGPRERVSRGVGDATSWLPGGRRLEEVDPAGPPVTLAPASTPLGRFLALALGTLVWNGFTGVFVVSLWGEISVKGLEPGLLCAAVFPLVGVLLLWATAYRFLALFGPRPFVTLGRPALRPGEAVSVAWRLGRMAWRARSVEVTLVGREAAPAGADSSVARTHVFLEQRLGPEPVGAPSSGQAVIQLPQTAMHSFASGGFKLEWLVRVRARVLLAPDLDEEFPLLVLPGRSS